MDAYLAEIRLFAGNFAPQNWMTCNGQLLSIAQNSALFALIGTTYGGDGQTTFALPNLVGRAPVHFGNGPFPYQVGQIAGAQSTTITPQQMPVHTHLVNVNQTAPNQGFATNNYIGFNANLETGEPYPFYADTTDGNTMSPKTIAPAGGNQPISIQSPVLAVTFMICISGLWPSRP